MHGTCQILLEYTLQSRRLQQQHAAKGDWYHNNIWMLFNSNASVQRAAYKNGREAELFEFLNFPSFL